jgi:hypothetical protein
VSILSGSLPGGLTLGDSGVLAGAPNVAGDFTFTVQAIDARSATVSKSLSITGGSFRLTLQVPPGSTCAGLTAGFPLSTMLSINWTTPDPAKPGKFKKVAGDKTTLASYLEPSTNPIVIGVTSQDFGVKSKIPGFPAKHAVMTFAIDQNTSELSTGCADKHGLALLTFTGVNAPSVLVIP